MMLRLCHSYINILAMLQASASAWTWAPHPTFQSGPRVSGQATASGPNRVYQFGGLTDGAGSPTTDDLWTFDESMGWALVEKGDGDDWPSRRMYAASACLDNSVLLFGGWDPAEPGSGGSFKDDVWSLDLDSLEWTELTETMPCGPVSRHTACTVGSCVVVHTFRGVLVCEKGGKLREQATTGEVPEGLSMCAAAPLGDSEMLVFGGTTKTQQMSSDAYVLNIKTWKWRRLRPKNGSGSGPSPRASSCAAPLGEASCIIFGGAGIAGGGYEGGAGLQARDETWIATITGDEVEWKEVKGAESPPGCVAASLNELPGGVPGRFVLQGGWDPTTKATFGKTWTLLGQ